MIKILASSLFEANKYWKISIREVINETYKQNITHTGSSYVERMLVSFAITCVSEWLYYDHFHPGFSVGDNTSEDCIVFFLI